MTNVTEEVDPDGAVGGFPVDFVDVDGVRTRYYDVGDGDPMLLLHGGSWGGSWSANTWSTVLDALGEQFRVLAPDRIATGMTGNPPDTDGYLYERELAHIVGFLDALGVDTAHVIGQSRGVGPAAYLAVDHPDRVSTLVAVNNRTVAPDVGDFGFRRFLQARGRPPDRSAPGDHADRFRHTVRGLSYTTAHLTEELVRTAAFMRSQPKALATEEALVGETLRRLRESKEAALDDVRARIRAGGLTVPTLLAWGRNDPIAPISQGTALFDLLSQHNPNVRLYLFDCCGHMPYREYPGEFAATVRTFIDTWTGAGRSKEAVQPEAYRTYYDDTEE